MENDLLKVIKIITLLYLEDKCVDNNPTTIDEARISLLTINVNNGSMSGLGSENSAIEALRFTAEWMITNTEGNFVRDDLIQRLEVNLHCENEYVDIVKKAIVPEVEPEVARSKVAGILNELRHDRKKTEIKNTIAIANAKINFSNEYIETGSFVTNLIGELEQLGVGNGDGVEPGFIGSVNFDDVDSIKDALEKGANTVSPEGVLDTGFRGLNEATGINGLPRGALVHFGALTHGYKSGMLVDLALNIPKYNKPWLWDETKKPLILRVSFENTIEQDITIIYKKLHGLKYGTPCDMNKVDLTVAAAEIQSHFLENGYTFVMEHYDASNFTVYGLMNVFNKYIDAGFEIHLATVDYLSMIAKNCVADRDDLKFQYAHEIMRNFCYPKGITLATASQLSSEALAIAREAPISFTKKARTGNYYMGCKGLSTKFDIEFLTHVLEHSDGKYYLSVSRGKNRYFSGLPEAKLNYYQPFDPVAGIVPDSGEERLYVRKLPSSNQASSDDAWSTD